MLNQRHRKIDLSSQESNCQLNKLNNIRKITGIINNNHQKCSQVQKNNKSNKQADYSIYLSLKLGQKQNISKNCNLKVNKNNQNIQELNQRQKLNSNHHQNENFTLQLQNIKPKILSVQELNCKRVGLIQLRQINLANGASKTKKLNLSLSKQQNDHSNSSLNKYCQRQSSQNSNNTSLCKKSKLSLISNKSIRKISALKIKNQNQNQEVLQKQQKENQKNVNIKVPSKSFQQILNNKEQIKEQPQNNLKFQHRTLKTTRQIRQYKPQQQKKRIKIYKKKYQSLNNILDLDEYV